MAFTSVLGIDPGPERTAWIHLEKGVPVRFGLDPNAVVRQRCEEAQSWRLDGGVAIEMIASYGMSVGSEVFETCVWIGRFTESLLRCNIPDARIRMLKRLDVKLHLCHSPKGNDASIRQALIDRFGPGKERAIGNKANPGPLYHIKADLWAALAVAVTHWDTVS